MEPEAAHAVFQACPIPDIPNRLGVMSAVESLGQLVVYRALGTTRRALSRLLHSSALTGPRHREFQPTHPPDHQRRASPAVAVR